MQMTNKNIIKLFLLILTLNLPLWSMAQCMGFAKNKCLPKLSPYNNSGQMYNTTLLSGDRTELSMTFYAGQNYRILVCAQKELGEVQFKLKDVNNNVIFSNKGYGNLWDFNVQVTQELTIEATTPASDPDVILDNSGCVAILVGFKQ